MIQLNLPKNCQVANYLPQRPSLGDLNQDLITVVIPNGTRIEVGWFPENDPAGEFFITVSRDNEELQDMAAADIHDLVSKVERLAKCYSEAHQIVGSATTTRTPRIQICAQ